MRTRKAFLNILASFAQQLTSVLTGFVIPAALIGAFGSETYGAIGTITQYLSFITLLESGVGGVTRAALYKPLASKDIKEISSIVRATESFFRKIGLIFIMYVLCVATSFPFITDYSGGWAVSFGLTLAIAAGTCAQYFFGLTYSLLLQADQRSYVTSLLQIVTSIINAVAIVILVNFGCGVVVVEAVSAIFFIIRPLVLGAYVKRRYRLIEDALPNNDALANRWDGLGHHLAFYLRSNVATVALSLLSSLSEVAVFSVYNLIANGLQKIVQSFTSGIEAAFGNMIAKDEQQALLANFRAYELISSLTAIAAFSTAISTVIPFVSVYTSGVSDTNYIRPLFAFLLLLATALYCFRLPYNSVVLAAGHYRQTRGGAFAEAILCVVLSFLLAGPFGLEGVAVALLVATLFRTINFGLYALRNIVKMPLNHFFRHMTFTFGGILACSCTGLAISSRFSCDGYEEWVCFAAIVFVISCSIALIGAALFYREDLRLIGKKFLSLVGRGDRR